MFLGALQPSPKSAAQELMGGTQPLHVQVLNLLSRMHIECLIN